MRTINLENFMKWANNLESMHNLCEFDYRRNGRLIGRISIRLEKDGSVGFGYLLDEDAEGYGYVTRAIQGLISLLKELGYREFKIIYNQNNTRSKAVAMRNGFLEVGLIPNPHNKYEISFIRAILIIDL